MKAIFNSRIIDSSDNLIKTNNRAFCYGDGLFETIVTGSERINLIEFHLDRLRRACAVMAIEFPTSLSVKRVSEMIAQLVMENDLQGDIRTKLSLWRNEGGLYSPTNHEASFLIEAKETDKPLYKEGGAIGVSKTYKTQYSPISFAKTASALTYVLAGNEKNERHLDDIILTDHDGNLSESHIANLFWASGSQIFTSALSTGCIAGVMRTYILDFFKNENNPVKEVRMTVDALNNAESIFTSNASGVCYFTLYEGRSLTNPKNLLEQLLIQLQQP